MCDRNTLIFVFDFSSVRMTTSVLSLEKLTIEPTMPPTVLLPLRSGDHEVEQHHHAHDEHQQHGIAEEPAAASPPCPARAAISAAVGRASGPVFLGE